MSYPKLLVPYFNDEKCHLRGPGDSNNDEDLKYIKDFRDADGYERMPTLCGKHVPSTQTVLKRVDEDDMCGECLKVASDEDTDLRSILN